jgi:hypothetical protein
VADELALDGDRGRDAIVRSFVAEVEDGDGIAIELEADGARAILSALELLRLQ